MEILTYPLNEAGFLYQQLYQYIKEDILAGKLTADEKLPSKRKLSQHLNISQTTVEIAYQQLMDEGYIYSQPKVGYFVEDIKTLNIAPMNEIDVVLPEQNNNKVSLRIEDSHNFEFPFQLFRKYARDAFELESKLLLERGDNQGDFALRNEIRRYLYHSRGVNCTNEQIIIGSSTEQLFSLVTRILSEKIYLLEDPGYPLIRKVLDYEALKYLAIPVDEEGIIVDMIGSQGEVVHITPSHQFPTGAVLSAKRRTELLNWANENADRYIVEDDYDSEFRYKGRPFKALQGMDANEKVIYMSTFSKAIFPSIRVAYMVLPEHLIRQYHAMSNKPSLTVPRHMQFMITRFMQDGDFERNINRMRKLYKKKSELALDALSGYKDRINISGENAGMHFIIEVKDVSNLEERLKQSEFEVTSMKRYLIEDIDDNRMIIGFGGLADEEIPMVIKRLMDSVFEEQ